jgi:hypothetical protein
MFDKLSDLTVHMKSLSSLSLSKMISHSMAKTHRTAVLLVLLCASCNFNSTYQDAIGRAFEQRQSNVQVEGEGIVNRILPDDNVGSPHQRFVVTLASGQTLLIQHNTNLAPRIDSLKTGDAVSFSGEYVWNEKGGLIHWTHHDPAGRHQAGWVKHNGQTYQ